MRWRHVRALLRKEALRVAAQRGPLSMALLIVVAAVLLATLGSRAVGGIGLGGEVGLCVVDHWREDPWVEHLRSHPPANPEHRVELRSLAHHEGWIRYPSGAAGIQLRLRDPSDPASDTKVWVWHPGGSGSAAAWCEAWFWQETRRHFLERVRPELPADEAAAIEQSLAGASLDETAWQQAQSFSRLRERLVASVAGNTSADGSPSPKSLVPRLEVERSALRGGTKASPRAAVAMGLALLSLLFVGVFLLPSISCEERERGTLLAIALSPASAGDILGAKLIFYFGAAFALAATVAGISVPSALARPFFWLSLAAVAFGAVAVGMTIAALARTQRSASMGALLYLFATGILLMTTRGSALEPVTWLLLERHGPELLLAALSGNVQRAHWLSLGITLALAAVWGTLARAAHRRSVGR